MAGLKDETLKLYEGGYHDLLNDVDKEIVMADVRPGSTHSSRPDGEADCGLGLGNSYPVPRVQQIRMLETRLRLLEVVELRAQRTLIGVLMAGRAS